MGNNVEDVLNEILKDYKSLARKAVRDAAHKGQKDVVKEAKNYLKMYYASYKPTMYKRTKNLKRAIVPVFKNASSKGNIVMEFGVEYNAGALEGVYKSRSRYHQSGDVWKIVPDQVRSNPDLFSPDYGTPEADWILDNFLRGEHGGAQRDFNATYTLMPDFFENELPNRIEKYIQDALLGAVVSKLDKL